MGNKVGKATETVRNRMSFRQRRPNDDNATEYNDAYIQTKFQNIPVLSPDEKEVIKSSWQIILTKQDMVSPHLDLFNFFNVTATNVINFAPPEISKLEFPHLSQKIVFLCRCQIAVIFDSEAFDLPLC